MQTSDNMLQIVCELAEFPGKTRESPIIGVKDVHIHIPLPPSYEIEAVWAATLQLHTRTTHVCFQVAEIQDGHGSKRISVCNVNENEQLHAVVSSLQNRQIQGDETEPTAASCRFNTAVTFSPSHPSDITLSQGIEVALHVADSTCSLIFRHRFMSSEEAGNMAATFSHILGGLVQDPTKTIGDLSLSPRDLNQITAWNSHDLDAIKPDWVLHQQFSKVASSNRDREAIHSWDGSMSYGALDNASTAVAIHLRRNGIGSGSRVLFCFHKSRWAVVSVLAILKAGGVCVPLDPRHPQRRVRQIIQKTGARHVLIGASDAAALLANSDADLDIIDVRDVPEVDQGARDPTERWPKVTADSPAMCLFTSGSTGTPKGIVLHNGHLYAATQQYKERYGVDKNTRILQFSAYTFDISVADTFLALLSGSTLCIPSEADRVDGLQDYIVRTRASWANLTPTVSRQLEPTVVGKSLRTLVLAGEPVRDSDVEAWVDARVSLYNVYGPAENALLTTGILARKGRASDIGYGANSRTWVVDMDTRSLVPVGAVGELLIESTQLALGYLDEPEKTRACFVNDVDFIFDLTPENNAPEGKRRFFRSGDLVRYREDGSLVYVGRADGQVKRAGQRIELGDIESHIQSDPRTPNTAVLLPTSGPLTKKLVSVVAAASSRPDATPCLSPYDTVLASDAIERLGKRIPAYMVPSIWLGINRVPLTGTGKTDRRALLLMLESVTEEEYSHLFSTNDVVQGGTHPLTEDQELLMDACSKVLNIPLRSISPLKSFIALGGDSITAMQVSFAMNKSSRKTIPVRDLLSPSSLLDAADCVVTSSASASVPSHTIQNGKRYQLSPIQRLFFETATSPATRNHYHQSVMMKLEEPRQPEQVEAALSAVIHRHPMLRVRFEKNQGGGEWLQYIVPAEEASPRIEVVDEQESVGREAAMLRARQAIDILTGPLVRAQLFTANKSSPHMLLFLVVHHLVVDLVSWRAILEEIEAALTFDLTASDERSYEESIPFLAWSELQAELAAELQPSSTLPSTSPPIDPGFGYWGLDPSKNVYKYIDETRITLDEEVTQRVLHDGHHAVGTEPVDILLAAIFVSFRRTFPERQAPSILTEGHGREPWDETLDIIRTVGWFTTMSPVSIGDASAGDVIDVVRRVKDHRRGTPNNGFDFFSSMFLNQDGRKLFGGYLPSEILFNYEGRYQAVEKEGSLLKPESWHAGEALADQGPELRRFCLFELAAAVLGGKMRLTCAWNVRTKHQDRINLWLTSLLPAAVAEISAVLTCATSRQLTLSDVELLHLRDYSEVSALTDSVQSIPGVGSVDDVSEILPGSPIQNALALSQSKTEDGAYEIEMTWEVFSPGTPDSPSSLAARVDPQALAAAWASTVARHPMLRTVVLEAVNADTSIIHQVVLKRFQPDCVILEANDTVHGLELLEAYPLYKEQGLFADMKPPHRLLICQTRQGKILLRLQMNHIVFDGMSTVPLLRNIAHSYGTVVGRGKCPPKKKNSPSLYADFLRYILDKPRRDESLAYWKQYLAGATPCYFPSLVTSSVGLTKNHQQDLGNPPQRQRRGQVPVHLDISTENIQATLQKLEVTLPALFQLVWALLLKTYLGGSQSVFGYLASGRDAPVDGIEHAIGPFISMLVCRVDFDRDRGSSVQDMMRNVQRASANAISHQEVSLAEIQDALELPGSSSLFNSGLTFLPRMTTEMQVREDWSLLFEEISLRDPTEFDLSLIVGTGNHINDEVSLHLDFLESSIGRDHAVNIADTVSYLVAQIIHDPSVKADDIVGLSQSNWNNLKSWNMSLPQPAEECTHSIFSRRVKEHPNREAVYSWDGSLTYRELDDLSDTLAKCLVSSYAVKVEQIVPVCFEKSLWTIVSVLAILKAGGCFVLLDPAQPESRLWTIIDQVEATLVVCSPLANKSKGLGVKAKEGGRPREVTLLEVDGEFMHNLRSAKISDNGIDTHLDQVPVHPDNAMYVVFTSGSTGTPKGAVATHRALATGLHEHADTCGMIAQGGNLRSLQFASYTFDASIGDIFTTIQAGGCLCIPRDEDRSPSDISAFISRSRANWAGITPSFASLLNPASIPTLKALCVAGEPLSSSLIDTWSHRVNLINMYGPTEGTVACIASTHVSRSTPASRIGRGYRTSTWIVDPDDHNKLQPIGAIGELLIEGPILCRGYLNRPETTAEAFIDGPPWLEALRSGSRLYKTGDLVRYDADGALIFIGRKDTQIKINGQRVETGEIEHAHRSCLGSSQGDVRIVVDLLKRGELGESDLLTAFVCVGGSNTNAGPLIATDHDTAAKLQELGDRFQHPHSTVSSLPQYMVPQAYVPLNRLPLTPSGKLDRRLLQQICGKLSRDELLGSASTPSPLPSSITASNFVSREEKMLAQMWEKVLHVKGVSRSSEFFRLGGNSMSALVLRSEARLCGLSLSVAHVFAHPVLADMALALSGGASTALQVPGSSTPESVSDEVNIYTPLSGQESIPEYASSIAEINDNPVKPFSLLNLEGQQLAEEIREAAESCNLTPDEIEDIFPSTPMQEALMVLAANSESKGAYGMHAPFRLPTDVEHERFQSAWEETTAAHSILRSRIVSRRGHSYVVVTKSAIPLRHVSVSSLSQYLKDEEEHHFEHGSPLCRLSIAHSEQDGCKYFIFGAHHAMYDGWSVKLTFKTFFKLYSQGISPRPGPPFQAFARELCLMDKAEAEEYWRGSLMDRDEEGFEFPVYPRSHKAVVRSNYGLDKLPFNPSAASANGVTITTLFHSAWALTLAQYTASQTVKFGVTLQGRDFPMDDIESVVGPIIVTAPRQLRVLPEQGVGDFLQAVHGVTVASLRYQHLGLHQIRALSPEAKRACDFSSLLVVNNTVGDDFEASLKAVGMEAVEIEAPDFHPYPIVLECFAGNQDYNLRVGFDPECIDQRMVERVIEQFQHNLQSLCRVSSSSKTTDLASVMADVAPGHVDTILEWTDATRSTVDTAKVPKVHHMLQRLAREHPIDMAVIGHDTPGLTFADLDSYAEALAFRIRTLGLVTKEAPFVALCLHNSAAAIVCMLAVLKAGSAFMPLNPSQPQARLRDLVQRANAKLALVSPGSHTFEDVECHVWPINMETIIQEHERYQLLNSDEESANKAARPASTDVAYLLFTSGTTGNPKGVMMEHGSWACHMRALMDYFKLGPGSRMLQFARYNFDACLLDVYVALLSGACICIPSYEQKMNDLQGYLLSDNVNSLCLTPTVARMLEPGNLPQVSWIVLLGEALAQADIDAWASPGRRIMNVYGPSETCLAVNARDVKPAAAPHKILKTCNNIGHAIGAAEWVMNPLDKTALVPIGAVGELLIEGPSLARGYHDDPERTKLSFPDHILDGLPGRRGPKKTRMYCSGDLVRLMTDGSFEYMGRRDGQVKLRGQRIDLGEIEHHIYGYMSDKPGFRSVSVQLYKPNADETDASAPPIEPYLGALVVMSGVPFTQEVQGVACQSALAGQGSGDGNESELQKTFKDLRRMLRSLLPDYMVPSAFIALERLPLALTGKLDRGFIQTCLHELSRESLNARLDVSSSFPARLSPDEELIRGWWAAIIGLDARSIGPSSDFFALGGNSISAMRLVGLARSSGFELRHVKIFRHPILSDMALHLTANRDDERLAGETARDQHFDLISKEEANALLGDTGISAESVEDMFPCTPMQEHLMAATSRHPGAYTIVQSMDVPLHQLPAIKKAWEAVFRTFGNLRTRIIVAAERGALQVVVKSLGLDWQDAISVEHFLEEVRDSTSYGQPLAQVAVLRGFNHDGSAGERQTKRILFTAHHAVFDAVFLDKMRQKLASELFLAENTTKDTAKTAAVTPFKIFVKYILKQDRSEAEAFWREKLADLSTSPLPPRLRGSRVAAERAPLATERISQELSIPTGKFQQRKRLGAAITVATVAHAAWALTISHYTASPDTLFGATLSGRDAAAASINDPESIAGPTITTVPYRTVIDYSESVSSFLEKVQEDAILAVRFGQLGLEHIARIGEDCRRACQFDSLFQVIQSADSGVNDNLDSPGGLVHKTVDTGHYFPSPLVTEVELAGNSENALIHLVYDPVIVQGNLPHFILDSYASILYNLLQADPHAPLSSVSAISEGHLSKIMHVGHGPSQDPWVEEYCMHSLVRKQVERSPRHPAIDAWDGLLSYAELDNVSSSLAGRLIHQGIGPDKSVCLLFEKSKWAIVAMLGVLKAGGCFIPLDPKHPQQRLQYLVETSKSTLILTSNQNLELCDPLPAQAIVVNETTLPQPVNEVTETTPQLPIPVGPYHAAYVLFTSGSTGTPKGVVVEHSALCSSTSAFSRCMRYDEDSRVLQFSSYWFDPMLLDIFCTLTHGGCVCVASEEERLNDLEGAINRFNVDNIIIAPSVSRAIEPDNVPSLKTVCLGGEAILPSDAERWSSKVRLVVGYGPTETCIVSAFGELKPSMPSNILGESVACRNWVVNPLKNELAPFGAIGELCTQGPNLARGYLGDERRTAASFIVAPSWMPNTDEESRAYRTGDLVCFNSVGQLIFVGRMGTSQVKIRGQRVELEEIEETIRKHIPSSIGVAVDIFEAPQKQEQKRPSVLAAAFGIGHDASSAQSNGPRVSSFMKDLTRQLLPQLTGTLPAYMVPEAFVPVPEIPLSTSGKLDRRALQKLAGPLALSAARGGAAEATREPPSTSMEKTIRSAWVKVLGIQNEDIISRWDNFISLGGDSILVMRLIAVLRFLNISLRVVDIFKNPTLADMSIAAEQVDEEFEDKADKGDDDFHPASDGNMLRSGESIHPCTLYQETFIHGANTYRGAHGVQLIFSIDSTVDLDRLQAAFDNCATWFPTLRTRIIQDQDSGSPVQAVSPVATKVSWSQVNNESDEFESVVFEDKKSPPGAQSRPLHRVTVAAQAGKHCDKFLIWHLNHAAYDGWSLGMMLEHIEKAYADPNFKPSYALPYNKFVDKARLSGLKSLSFWETYLDGVKPASLLFNYASIQDPVQDRMATHRVSFPTTKRKGATAATFILAAWALVLSKLTKSRDILLAHLVTGRAMPLAGIETCPGPTINKVPLRIRLPQEPRDLPDLDAVASIVSSELMRVMPYEQGGLLAIRKLVPHRASSPTSLQHAGFVLGKLPLDLGIHLQGHLEFTGGAGIGMEQLDARPTAAPPGAFSVECKFLPGSASAELELAVLWDGRAASEGDVEMLVTCFRDTLAI